MTDGARPDYIVIDEAYVGGPPWPPGVGTRTVIAQRPDRSTYTLKFPADRDVGEVLPRGDVIAYDAGTAACT